METEAMTPAKNYKIGLTIDQAEKLITIGHEVNAAGGNLADVNARFAWLLRLYLDCFAIDALAEVVPGRRRNEAFYVRRGLVQDLQRYGGPKTVMRFFDRLRALNMVDAATASAVENDLRQLAGSVATPANNNCKNRKEE
jgi:hypothetical protein